MTPSETEPLPADPRRQADAMFRACEYQILQTVNAWLDLRGDEVIYVEGAEDFDLHSPQEAEAVQVKTSPQPISLGQSEIQKFLNNYWKLRRASAGRNVKVRFLTCAPFAVERETPFGENVSCLEVWQRRPVSDCDAQQLASFLAKQSHIDSDFRTWLASAAPMDIRKQLVECVTWQAEAEGARFLERIIYSKLATFAEKHGAVPASIAKQVAQRLVEEIWKVLRAPPPRRLDFFRIEELWEETTHISVPRSVVEARWNTGFAVQSGSPLDSLRDGTPPLPGTVAHRSKLVSSLRALLAAKRFLGLHGSTRTGKTTLAKLIALLDDDKWKWWSACSVEPGDLCRQLQSLAVGVAGNPGIINLVLDDLNFSPLVAREIEAPLGELVSTIRSRYGRLIITSQKPLQRSLQHVLEIEARQIVSVPRLEEDEVVELALAFGCMDEGQRWAWGQVVWATSGGHPQLAAVQFSALRDQGWPQFEVETLASGTEAVDAEKADARQLMDGINSDQRDLLQRLSVFPLSFRRDHAVALGAEQPPIKSPGNVFDALVGPWVEPLHGGYFSLSPLLAGAARAALAAKDFDELQEQAALVLLKARPASTRARASAFRLYWEMRNDAMLMVLTESFIDLDGVPFASLAMDLWWFTIVSPGRGRHLFPESPLLSLMLRWLQLRVAMAAAPNHVVSIVEGWEWELANDTLPDHSLHRFTFAGFVLPYTQVPLDADTVVRMLGEVAEAAEAYPEMPIHELAGVKLAEMEHLSDWQDIVSTLSFFCSPRCTTIGFLEDFLKALQKVTPELRKRILRGFVGRGIEMQMAVDRAWIAESDKEAPDWSHCILVFESALELGRAWGCPELTWAAIRGICVVMDEYLDDHAGAHQVLNRIVSQDDLPGHLVHDRRASIFFTEGNHSAAEDEWRLAFANWPSKLAVYDSSAAFAARSAGISAARQARWQAAAEWFEMIVRWLPENEQVAFKAGAYADAGYCFWKAGLKERCVAALIEAWRLADTLPSGREDLRAFITRKTTGHVIAWLAGQATQNSGITLHEPVAGVCSSAEMPEKMRELPETEGANIWLFLIMIERAFGAGNRASDLGGKSIEAASNPGTRSLVAFEAIGQNLTEGRVEAIPANLIELARTAKAAASLVPEESASKVTLVAPEIFEANDVMRGAPVFLAALVAARAKGKNWQDVLALWRSSAPAEPINGWSPWFDVIEKVLGGNLREASILVGNSSTNWDTMMLGAWHLLCSDDSSPDHLFCAHARWLCGMGRSPWFARVSEAFCLQMEEAWGRATASPAFLRQPRITVPAIVEARAWGRRGYARAARILLAASAAVSAKMSPEILSVIRRLAECQAEEG